jgi:hypothetical protein
MAIWPRPWAFLVLGYGLFGRSFAYLGVPGLKLFIGEVVLAAFVLMRGGWVLGTWSLWLLRRGTQGLLGWSLLLFVLYGLFQVLYGLFLGHDTLLVLQNFVFNLYPLYLFLGLFVGRSHPSSLGLFSPGSLGPTLSMDFPTFSSSTG